LAHTLHPDRAPTRGASGAWPGSTFRQHL